VAADTRDIEISVSHIVIDDAFTTLDDVLPARKERGASLEGGLARSLLTAAHLHFYDFVLCTTTFPLQRPFNRLPRPLWWACLVPGLRPCRGGMIRAL